jgi:hypothetical protein
MVYSGANLHGGGHVPFGGAAALSPAQPPPRTAMQFTIFKTRKTKGEEGEPTKARASTTNKKQVES